MWWGVGGDSIDVAGWKGGHERHGDRFLNRILTREERDYCFGMKNPYPHIAARFAAKEAVSKAFSTGIGGHLKWTSISVYKGERQQPLVRLDDMGRELLRMVGGTDVLLSISHTQESACCVALIVTGLLRVRAIPSYHAPRRGRRTAVEMEADGGACVVSWVMNPLWCHPPLLRVAMDAAM